MLENQIDALLETVKQKDDLIKIQSSKIVNLESDITKIKVSAENNQLIVDALKLINNLK